VRAAFWHTNTVENFFSIFKRGIIGVYHHVSETHLHRYGSEFDFRYNYRMSLGYSDADRARLAVKGIEGKRLTYRRPDHPAKGLGLEVCSGFLHNGGGKGRISLSAKVRRGRDSNPRVLGGVATFSARLTIGCLKPDSATPPGVSPASPKNEAGVLLAQPPIAGKWPPFATAP
jgi:hypothetical protein